MSGEGRDSLPAGPIVAFGGDVILGGWQNALTARDGPGRALAGIPELAEADLAIVNLESVIAGSGAPVAKGTPFAFYFRGRPELLAVLTAAGIDVVCTANNHSGDYGSDALLEQGQLLDDMNLGHAGSGPNRATACRPVFRRAGELTVAVFAVDSTMPGFAATNDRSGTCYLSPDDASAWRAFFAPRISAARQTADVVLVAVHCGRDFEPEPRQNEMDVCRALIDSGADAVLGSSTHVPQGVEIYQGRPIIYDAGNLLWHNPRRVAEAAVFSLVLAPNGVQQVRVTPIASAYGVSRPAEGEQGQATLTTLRDRSAELGTRLVIQGDRGLIELPPLPPRAAPSQAAPSDPLLGSPPVPRTVPPADCVVSVVPDEARIDPVAIGPLTLLGVSLPPGVVTEKSMLQLDTYWTCNAPLAADLSLAIRVEPRPRAGLVWQDEHELCDWMWPTSRWTPGTIFRDHCRLRPPGRPRRPGQGAERRLVAAELVVWVGLRRWGEPVGVEQAVMLPPHETGDGGPG